MCACAVGKGGRGGRRGVVVGARSLAPVLPTICSKNRPTAAIVLLGGPPLPPGPVLHQTLAPFASGLRRRGLRKTSTVR